MQTAKKLPKADAKVQLLGKLPKDIQNNFSLENHIFCNIYKGQYLHINIIYEKAFEG